MTSRPCVIATSGSASCHNAAVHAQEGITSCLAVVSKED